MLRSRSTAGRVGCCAVAAVGGGITGTTAGIAGEVLNMDGVTGGYNFQAAWAAAFVAARAMRAA